MNDKTEASKEVTKQETKPNAAELALLVRQKADAAGVTYTAEDSVDAIRERINAKLTGESIEAKPEPVLSGSKEGPRAKTKEELRQEAILEATRLIRVRITNMDPRKADLAGEYFTVSNGVVGQITRYIPYAEQEDGWHIEKMLLDMLKEKQFHQLRPKKGSNGAIIPDGRWVREFNIEELEPLTQAELKVLANKQAAAAGQAAS